MIVVGVLTFFKFWLNYGRNRVSIKSLAEALGVRVGVISAALFWLVYSMTLCKYNNALYFVGLQSSMIVLRPIYVILGRSIGVFIICTSLAYSRSPCVSATKDSAVQGFWNFSLQYALIRSAGAILFKDLHDLRWRIF